MGCEEVEEGEYMCPTTRTAENNRRRKVGLLCESLGTLGVGEEVGVIAEGAGGAVVVGGLATKLATNSSSSYQLFSSLLLAL